MNNDANIIMNVSPNSGIITRHYENCKLTAYWDANGKVWTIGWGNTYYENGSKVKQGDIITQQRADSLFSIIQQKFVLKTRKLIVVPVVTQVFDAMVDFTYNTGGYYKDRASGKIVPYDIWHSINSGYKITDIASQLEHTAIHSGNKVMNGLIYRRKTCANLMVNNVVKFFN